eukprot:gnl/MRDRNA2_/MRDRNA2_19665_c0_seq1.p1 gnl/MRDRNA2_/MRDRNA2_19665_c0~~gnl/MRDRNA2_/MRDRNA2_19665_c0_seq1.p1  ORF type:complete len:308 (+),score=49.89 gnl/MRDRNA2_/MRDRNA2_19665_c0_seq1:53-925(+)
MLAKESAHKCAHQLRFGTARIAEDDDDYLSCISASTLHQEFVQVWRMPNSSATNDVAVLWRFANVLSVHDRFKAAARGDVEAVAVSRELRHMGHQKNLGAGPLTTRFTAERWAMLLSTNESSRCCVARQADIPYGLCGEVLPFPDAASAGMNRYTYVRKHQANSKRLLTYNVTLRNTCMADDGHANVLLDVEMAPNSHAGHAGAFILGSAPELVVAPGQSIDVLVQADPSQPGPFHGMLRAMLKGSSSQCPKSMTASIPLSGLANDPQSPSQLTTTVSNDSSEGHLYQVL